MLIGYVRDGTTKYSKALMWSSVKNLNGVIVTGFMNAPCSRRTLTIKSVLVDDAYNLDTRLVSSAC